MKIGAHVSTAGGLHTAFGRADEMGAETIQIFASSPRAWKFRDLKPEVVQQFHEASGETGIAPVFIHGSYLVNIAGTPELIEKSVECLIRNMEVAAEIGATGVVFHAGSHKGRGFDAVIGAAASALTEVLEASPPGPLLLVENSAGMGAHLGASFEELGEMISAVGSDRFKVCLDTEHCFAAGYDIANPDVIDAAMEEFDNCIGLDRLVVVHANDAKVEMGSGVDRHDNIGEGHIGIEGFEVIMGHEAFSDVPFILEVPGPDKKGPDKDNVDRLKDIRSRLQSGA
ncbi:MAG: deoxyribonuclease IV [Dehalococcoidia bacterium]|nr:deoxyribonuclease IV [Dehalococcoidia bacterium]